MALSKQVKLGEYLTFVDVRNKNNEIKKVMGVSTRKEFREPTSKVDKDNLSNYKIVKPGQFSSVQTTHNEKCFAFAYNDSNEIIVVSSVNLVFEVDQKVILPRWLQMYFTRKECDRYARFHSWGSAREIFGVDDIRNIVLDIPPIEIQKKYVAIYEGMLANLHSYEKGLDDLKLVCDGYIEDLRRKLPRKKVGEYITFRNEKNKNNEIKLEQGIDIGKHFITPQRGNSNLSGRKIVRKGDIAYCSQLNNENVAVAYREGEDCVVSSVYESFYINDESKLNPKYLFLWLSRKEFGRYVYWKSTGTSYEFLDGNNIVDLLIPIPSKKEQDSIVAVLEQMESRKKYLNELKSKISSICPVLIRGSILEAQGGN